MLARYVRRPLLFVFAGALAWAAVPAATPTCVIAPFENRSGDANLNWIGESFVLALTQALQGTNLSVLNRSEWSRALALAGAPAGESLSHATLIRIADSADAQWLVVGWFSYDGDQLQAEASLINLQREHLVTLAPVTGALDDLEKLQQQLGWGLRQQMAPGTGPVTTLPQLPLVSYENYVRALMATNQTTRLIDLKVAAHFAPADPRIQLELGQAYLDGGDNANAYPAFMAVPATADQYLRAQFGAGLAAFKLQDYAHAVASFERVAQRLPLPSVEADLALAKAQAQPGAAPADGKLEADFPIDEYRQLMGAVAQFDSHKAATLPVDQQIAFDLAEGQRLQAQGGLDAAESQYHAALTLLAGANAEQAAVRSEISGAHVGLAKIWMARHQPDKAVAEVNAALHADPGNLAAQALQRQLGKDGGRG